MNALVQKFAPPAIVFSTAIYLGLPPAAPLDLGESVVKAATVRWKKDDLKAPVINRLPVDPFAEVLVASEEMEVEPDTGKLVVATKPAGPEPDAIQSALTLSGIASMGGRSWAVMNGKPRLEGDVVVTNDSDRYRCTIVSVERDHVVVSCEETTVKIRPAKFGSSKPAAATQVSKPVSASSDTSTPTQSVAPPPIDSSSAPPVNPPALTGAHPTA